MALLSHFSGHMLLLLKLVFLHNPRGLCKLSCLSFKMLKVVLCRVEWQELLLLLLLLIVIAVARIVRHNSGLRD